MSDWAAKLSQKPVANHPQNSTKGASSNSYKSQAKTGPTAKLEQPNNGFEGQNSPRSYSQQHHSSQKLKPTRITNSASPISSSSHSPEPFNGDEVLAWMNKRYNADLEDAQKDKAGETAVIYRSLEASSSWKTKGSNYGRKHAKEEYRFDMLSEINRSFLAKSKKN